MVSYRKDLDIDPLCLALEHKRLTVLFLDRIEVYIRALAREVVGAEHRKANIRCALVVDRRNLLHRIGDCHIGGRALIRSFLNILLCAPSCFR